MGDLTYLLAVILAMGLVTFALRALPFVAASRLRRQPWLSRLGRWLPMSIMVLLCLHATLASGHSHPHGALWDGLVVLVVVLLQWWRRQALLSMALGTLLYVLLRQHLLVS